MNLRARVVRFVIGAIVGFILGWIVYSPLLAILTPKDFTFHSLNAAEPFVAVLWFSSAMAIVIALPIAFFPGRYFGDWIVVAVSALTSGTAAYLIVQRRISWFRNLRLDFLPEDKPFSLSIDPHLETIPLAILVVEIIAIVILCYKSPPVAHDFTHKL